MVFVAATIADHSARSFGSPVARPEHAAVPAPGGFDDAAIKAAHGDARSAPPERRLIALSPAAVENEGQIRAAWTYAAGSIGFSSRGQNCGRSTSSTQLVMNEAFENDLTSRIVTFVFP